MAKPKILVADDNSNVQKTVALALADLGVEVVAVNNGDAAVRKLPDVNPDLVLADIFMPVRNGYEVCEYVKKDSRFAHVPVVLLVGAFDPLDEREAQRVAADGILKKPFVPPDPLIAMVKTLLDRSVGERLVTVGAPPTPVTEQSGAGAAAREISSAAKVKEPPPIRTAPSAPIPAPEPLQELTPEEELPPPVDRLSFGEGNHPIAFSQLLETPAQNSAAIEAPAIEPVEEPVSDDQVLTSARDANLGEPIFWKAEEPEAEGEEGQSEAEEENARDYSSGSWGLGEASMGEIAERGPSGGAQAGTIEPVQQVEPIEPFELVRDETEEGMASSVVEPSSLVAQDAAAQASLTVQSGRAEDLAANPLDWMATAPPPHLEDAPAEEAEAETPWNPEEMAGEGEEAHAAQVTEEAPEEFANESTLPPPPPLGVIPAPSLLGMPAPPITPRPTEPPQAKTAPPVIEPRKAQPPFKPLDRSAEDTAHSIPKQDWTDLAASLEFKPASPADKPRTAQVPTAPPPLPSPVANDSSSAQSNGSTNVEPDPALVEAVVQRVLDKMRPQVVDIITKEFLRPVVQALVHREITKH